MIYQWYKDGTPISGATEATLELNSVTVLDSGKYSVQVTDTITSKTKRFNARYISVTVVALGIGSAAIESSFIVG